MCSQARIAHVWTNKLLWNRTVLDGQSLSFISITHNKISLTHEKGQIYINLVATPKETYLPTRKSPGKREWESSA